MRILELNDRDRITVEISFENAEEFDNWLGERDFERMIIRENRDAMNRLDELDMTEAH